MFGGSTTYRASGVFTNYTLRNFTVKLIGARPDLKSRRHDELVTTF